MLLTTKSWRIPSRIFISMKMKLVHLGVLLLVHLGVLLLVHLGVLLLTCIKAWELGERRL